MSLISRDKTDTALVNRDFARLSRLTRKEAVILFLLGFSSGVPLLLTASTLAMRLDQVYGISYHLIALMSLAALPYALKFIWSPLIDSFRIPFISDKMGLRRSWLLLSQLSLFICLLFLSVMDVGANLLLTSIIVFIISLFSATQETSFLAYQADNINKQKFGSSEAFNIFGYRTGMLLSSAGVLYIASFFDWHIAYTFASFGVLLGVTTTIFVLGRDDNPLNHDTCTYDKKTHMSAKILEPFLKFKQINNWHLVLLLMFTYKLGDNLIGNMSNIYYSYLGFSNIEIANASKIFGMIASILGGFLASYMIKRNNFNHIKTMSICLVLHAMASFMYLYLYYLGNDIKTLYFIIALENVTSGMRTIALLSFQLYLCNGKFSATKIAIMTSVIHLSRVVFSSSAGFMIEQLNWNYFFLLVPFSYMPALLLLIKLKKLIKK